MIPGANVGVMEMSRRIRYCLDCKEYTMYQSCPSCGKGTILSGPQRFSPEDRYGEYRRRAKKEALRKEAMKGSD